MGANVRNLYLLMLENGRSTVPCSMQSHNSKSIIITGANLLMYVLLIIAKSKFYKILHEVPCKHGRDSMQVERHTCCSNFGLVSFV